MRKRKVGLGLVALIILLGVGYGAGIGYYAEKFQANTQFGSVDISNLNLDQAKAKIKQDLVAKQITIKEGDKQIGQTTLGQLGFQADIDQVLEDAYQSQDPVNWVSNFFSSATYDDVLLEHVTFDGTSMTQVINDLGISNELRTPAVDAKVTYSADQGYYVEEAIPGNQVDIEALQVLITKQVQQGQVQIDISQAYLQPLIKADDEVVTDVMDRINQVADTKLTLTINGTEEVIPRDLIMEWIYFDESNNLSIDYEGVRAYLATLNDKYATYDKVRTFNSTWQGQVQIQPGTLGWSIDRETEANQIINDLLAAKDVTRDPAIVGSGYGGNGDDIGNSYVEVSIPDQTMFIYVDGVQVLQTAIITGMPGTNTIPGAYAIWSMQSPAVLKGYNQRYEKTYEQPVSYWVAFDNTGQGIHDANWQSSFGGNTYLYSGSLGCVNVQPGVMPTVYAYVYNGMPVIIY